MKTDQETKPETSKGSSEGSGGAVDLRAKLLARRKAQSAQINGSGHTRGSASKDNEDQCVSKVLASGLNIGSGDDDDDDDDEDDDEYMDIEDEDGCIEDDTQVGHGTTGEDWTIIAFIPRKLLFRITLWRGLSELKIFIIPCDI